MSFEMLTGDKRPYEAPKVKKRGKASNLEIIAAKARLEREAKELVEQKQKLVNVRPGVVKRVKGYQPTPREEILTLRSSMESGRGFELAMAGRMDVFSKNYQADYDAILGKMLDLDKESPAEKKKKLKEAKETMLYDVGLDLATWLVKKNQQTDPVKPTAPFGKAIKKALIEALGVTDPKKQDHIKFYTAVSKNKISLKEAGGNKEEMFKTMTALDAYYGTDCFVELGGDLQGDSQGFIIPFDLTVNREKVNPKAIIVRDIAIPDDPRDKETQETFDKYALQLAKQVITEIPESTRGFLTT